MKAEIKKVVTVTLILTQEEAWWLKGMMQNSFFSKESAEDQENRENLFNALPPLGEPHA